MNKSESLVAPAMKWQLDGCYMEDEQDWRGAYLVEAMWRANAPLQLRMLRQLRQVDPQLAEAIWDTFSLALCDASLIARAMVEALLLGTPVPDAVAEDTEAHEGEQCLAALVERARVIYPIQHTRLYDRVTDVAIAARYRETIGHLVDIHLAALKAGKWPE
ncbi:MAG TPA: hypothetical protein VKX16_12360 [Chloroflexota bacterium]|nr:hypothetical protein [Chloroflexota bacterium]